MATASMPIDAGHMEAALPLVTRPASPNYTLARLGLMNKHTVGFGKSGISEYQDRYKALPLLPPRNSRRPPLHLPEGHADKMDMQTSYGETFIQHPLQARKERKKEEYVPPDRDMDCKTIYGDDYSSKPIMRATSFKPNNVFKEPTIKMGVESEYQATYLTNSQETADRCRSLPAKRKECLERVKDKFVAVSTVQNDYQKHENVKRVKPIIQKDNEFGDKAPFDSMTTYGEYYTHKLLELQPPKEKKPYRSQGAPFKGLTTFQADFRPPVNPVRHPMYRPPEIDHCPDPFEGSTTQRTTYKSWPVERRLTPQWAKKNVYQRPRGGMLLCSTYDREYRDPGVVNRVQPTKKGSCGVIFGHGDVPMEKPDQATTYGANYKPWKHSKSAEVQKTYNLYVPPKEKLTTESIHRSHFKGQYAPPARPCHPKSENWQQQPGGHDPERMHFLTTYKETYTGDTQRVLKRKRMRKPEVRKDVEVKVVPDKSGDPTEEGATASEDKGDDSSVPGSADSTEPVEE